MTATIEREYWQDRAEYEQDLDRFRDAAHECPMPTYNGPRTAEKLIGGIRLRIVGYGPSQSIVGMRHADRT